MIPPRKSNPRAEHRLRQSLRAKESVSLAAKFPRLESLMVELAYFSAEGKTRQSEIKYKVNLEHAKSVFCFACPNGECVAGDFDLSENLAKAVGGRRKVAIGEMQCQGWHKKPKDERTPCHILLRYKLSLNYV